MIRDSFKIEGLDVDNFWKINENSLKISISCFRFCESENKECGEFLVIVHKWRSMFRKGGLTLSEISCK